MVRLEIFQPNDYNGPMNTPLSFISLIVNSTQGRKYGVTLCPGRWISLRSSKAYPGATYDESLGNVYYTGHNDVITDKPVY